MSSLLKKIIFYTFIALFFILTASLIIMARGYRINFKYGRLEKTGILIVKTEPRGADVLIDGEKYQSFYQKYFSKDNYALTPAKIKNLFPGKYDLIIKKDGFFNREDKINIGAGLTLSLDQIYLLPISAAETLLTSKTGNIKIFQNNNNFFAAYTNNQNNLFLSNLNNNNIENLGSVAGKDFSFFENSIIDGNTFFDINSTSTKLALPEDAKMLYYANGQVYYSYADSLYASAPGQTGKKIADAPAFQSLQIKNGYYAGIARDGQTCHVFIAKEGDYKNAKQAEFNCSTNSYFDETKNNFFIFHDAGKRTAYIFDPNAQFPLKNTINNITNIFYLDGFSFFYTDGFENWSWNSYDNKSYFISRLSEEIIGMARHPESDYLIYATSKNIFASRKKNEGEEILTLFSEQPDENITNINLDEKNLILYFTSRDDNGNENIRKINI